MKILVACEYSGIVRDAFLSAGHEAVSCDLLESETPGPHHCGDVRPLLRERWDLVIAHPPCTYLTNAGVRWLWEDCKETTKQERWLRMFEACRFFAECMNANSPRVAVENPVMHQYARDLIGARAAQTLQPWQYGHGETKAVCLWLKSLPPLVATEVVEGRLARVHKMPPGKERQKERSRFFAGIAAAMSVQWGDL